MTMTEELAGQLAFAKAMRRLSDCDMQNIPDREYIVEGMIPLGFPGMVYAPGGTGKSFLVTELTTAVALGENFWGQKVPKARKILLYTAELDEREVLVRYRALWDVRYSNRNLEEFQTRLAEQLCFHDAETLAPFLPFDIEDHGGHLQAAILEAEAELCVIDPFNGIHNRDENSNSDMGQILSALRCIGNTTGCTFLLVHHCSKADSVRGVNTTGRGAVALRSNTQWSYALERHPKDLQGVSGVLCLRNEKANLHVAPEPIWLLRGEGGILNRISKEEADGLAGAKDRMEESKVAILEAIQEGWERGEYYSPSSLKDVEGVPKNKHRRDAILEELEDAGLTVIVDASELGIKRQGGGKVVAPADRVPS